MNKRLAATVIVLALAVGLFGCSTKNLPTSTSAGYPGFATPKATVDTFFTSKMKKDFDTTWTCYYKHYSDKVTKAEFLQHSKQDPTTLTAYSISDVTESTSTAQAKVALTFATNDPANKVKKVDVTEQLVKESGEWKISVW